MSADGWNWLLNTITYQLPERSIDSHYIPKFYAQKSLLQTMFWIALSFFFERTLAASVSRSLRWWDKKSLWHFGPLYMIPGAVVSIWMPLTSFQLNCLFYMYLCLCTVTWVMLMVCFLCRIGLRSATPKLNVRKRSTWILLKGCTDTHEAHQTTAHSARCRVRRPLYSLTYLLPECGGLYADFLPRGFHFAGLLIWVSPKIILLIIMRSANGGTLWSSFSFFVLQSRAHARITIWQHSTWSDLIMGFESYFPNLCRLRSTHT